MKYYELIKDVYSVLSRNDVIKRNRKFQIIEVNRISCYFLKREKKIEILGEFIDLHEKICKYKIYLQYKDSIIYNNSYFFRKFFKNKYNKLFLKYNLLKIRLNYIIRNIDKTQKKDIILSFKYLTLYNRILERLYEDNAKSFFIQYKKTSA